MIQSDMATILLGTARWVCDGCHRDGHFTTPEPDRSLCVEQWISDLSHQVTLVG